MQRLLAHVRDHPLALVGDGPVKDPALLGTTGEQESSLVSSMLPAALLIHYQYTASTPGKSNRAHSGRNNGMMKEKTDEHNALTTICLSLFLSSFIFHIVWMSCLSYPVRLHGIALSTLLAVLYIVL